MAIKKRSDGKWLVNITPGGRNGKQLKRIFGTQAEAKQFVIWANGQYQKDADWAPKTKDSRKLSELIERWHNQHGSQLAAGNDTYARLKAMAVTLGDPIAAMLTKQDFADYRINRLNDGVSPSTVNREHAYLRSVFNELERLGEWSGENPLAKIRQLRIQERELSYLSLTQIATLLKALGEAENPHVLLITKVCLATGGRWGEVETLQITQVRDKIIQFANRTKNSKSRALPIGEDLEREIHEHYSTHGKNGRIFSAAYSAFGEGVNRAKIDLPKGQRAHVLRHTFASHFMINGGNILTLQRALGHASLTMTMRYAHLSPDHLQEVRTLNPLSSWQRQLQINPDS